MHSMQSQKTEEQARCLPGQEQHSLSRRWPEKRSQKGSAKGLVQPSPGWKVSEANKSRHFGALVCHKLINEAMLIIDLRSSR